MPSLNLPLLFRDFCLLLLQYPDLRHPGNAETVCITNSYELLIEKYSHTQHPFLAAGYRLSVFVPRKGREIEIKGTTWEEVLEDFLRLFPLRESGTEPVQPCPALEVGSKAIAAPYLNCPSCRVYGRFEICGEKVTVTKRCLLPKGHQSSQDEDPPEEECETCRGVRLKARLPEQIAEGDGRFRKCPVCGGNGKGKINTSAPENESCDECHGTGYVRNQGRSHGR